MIAGSIQPRPAPGKLDIFNTAFADAARVKAGDTVWLLGGTYKGPWTKPASPAGTRRAPIIYRAAPGQRVTLTADRDERYVLGTASDHTWFWGLEIRVGGEVPKARGHGVNILSGHGAKLIN